MKIVNMTALGEAQLAQAAALLHEGIPEGWPTFGEAAEEIVERLVPENTLLAAVEEDTVLGWGGILAPTYDGRVYELHPLVVSADVRGQGIGRALVEALEDAARQQGGVILWMGADDEREGGETSLANVDLFDDLPGKLRDFDPGTHQTAFYLRLGYQIIGVMPDANGPGKPDIYLGKRL